MQYNTPMLVTETDLSGSVTKLNAKRWHGSNDGNKRLDSVAINNRFKLLGVLTCEATLMDNSTKHFTNYHSALQNFRHHSHIRN